MTVRSLQTWSIVGRVLTAHLRRRWWVYACAAALYAWALPRYRLALNMSDSLPASVYLVEVGRMPDQAGQHVAFLWQRGVLLEPDRILIKRVGGLPGQVISVEERMVRIDGRRVGWAKPVGRNGMRLTPIAPGVIPVGHLYATAPHPDSLDSRYQLTGLVRTDRIVGRAHALF